jgi:hypothetical protein
MKRKVCAGDETFVLIPEKTFLPQREEVLMWINYEFGFPKQLPSNLKVLDPEELGALSYAGPYTGVLVPIETARKIASRQISLPAGVEAVNMRTFSNQLGETYALADFNLAARREGVSPSN